MSSRGPREASVVPGLAEGGVGRLLIPAVLLFAILGLWLHAASYSFISDDAYISFRYAYNLAMHGDFSFNLGERVEGYTNFLWTLMLALLLKVGLRPEVTSQLFGAFFGGATLVLIYVLTRLYRGGRRNPWDMLAALLLPSVGGFAVWCSGGLETQFFGALVLGGVVLYLAESAGRVRRPLSGGIFALAAMTRPEGLLLFGLTGLHRLGANLLGERRLMPRGREMLWVLGFVIPFGVFMGWRISYYGYPFPNTYYVKAGGDHWLMLNKWGLPYLWDFIHLNKLYVFAPFALLFWPRTVWRKEDVRHAEPPFTPAEPAAGDWLAAEKASATQSASESEAAPEAVQGEHDGQPERARALGALPLRPAFVWSYIALLVLPFMAYVCLVGGDFMAMGRFFLPVLPLVLFFGQEALREALERPRRVFDSWRPTRFVPVLVVLLGLGVLNAFVLHRVNAKMRYHRWGLDTVGYLRKFAADRVLVGRWLRDRVPKDTFLAVGGAGAIVYASRLRALDTFGLNDTWIAHKAPRSGDRPGHSKSAPQSYILKQKPDLMCHRARHQDWPYKPPASEARSWRRQGYKWVCIDPPGLRPRNYCCLKRLDRDLGVWPAEKR
ncbi:MAG: hypothetical protein JRH20_03800 [Deltaproteobacteria bacterium]|nr:hypothetical protein [Deltaproteobacteria bacterium]